MLWALQLIIFIRNIYYINNVVGKAIYILHPHVQVSVFKQLLFIAWRCCLILNSRRASVRLSSCVL